MGMRILFRLMCREVSPQYANKEIAASLDVIKGMVRSFIIILTSFSLKS